MFFRVEETPKTVASSSTPQPKPRTSLSSSQPKSGSPEPKTDDKQFNPPDLPKKERDSTPPLPPKTDDVPLLPPKVIAPTSDMVVADMPPVRCKSEELLESPPPPCEVVSSDSDNQGIPYKGLKLISSVILKTIILCYNMQVKEDYPVHEKTTCSNI